MLFAAGARRKAGWRSGSSRNAKSRARSGALRTCAQSARICSNWASAVICADVSQGPDFAVLTGTPPRHNGRSVKAVLAAAVCVACVGAACTKATTLPAPPTDQIPAGVRASVLQHHNDAARSGVYVDAALTREAVRHLRRDPGFNAPVQGSVYAQPLYWDGGEGGQDLLIVATQRNEVVAFDPISGARVWSRTVAAPVSR